MKARTCVLLLAAAAACGGSVEPPTGEGYTELTADNIMIGVSTTATSDGVRSATGTYDTVFVYNDSASYRVKGVHQQLFDSNGLPSATIRADSGVLNTITDATIARGKVVLITRTGCQIETEELHYDAQNRSVWSDVHTRFLISGKVTTAETFRADDGFNNVTGTRLSGAIPEGCG
jgi:LPS export ABC transporter protein LptC